MHGLRQQARAMPGQPSRTGAAMVADGFTPGRGGDLVIVGAGGFGRETAQAVHAINECGGAWRLLGFLDDDPARHGTSVDGTVVISGRDEIWRLPSASVVVCTGGQTTM